MSPLSHPYLQWVGHLADYQPLFISIKEFSWEREGNGSTLGTEEPEQQEVVYIMNLEDGLRKDSTALYDEKGPKEKSLLRETGLLKCPP